MTVQGLRPYLKKHWLSIKEELLAGRYQPRPVKRVAIPKPGGGKRKLGIPTVLDRFIQQALLQVLQAQWDLSFSDASYGFRPSRNAHQTVLRLIRHYLQSGALENESLSETTEGTPQGGPHASARPLSRNVEPVEKVKTPH